MARTTVTKRGQVTIPREIRECIQLREGEVFSVEATEGGIFLRRWDPEHDPSDWQYHAEFAPRGPSYGHAYSGDAFLALLDSWSEYPDERPDADLRP